MEFLSLHHHHHHHQNFFNNYGSHGGEVELGMDQASEMIYKNFRKNMEFDILFEKLKRNRYELQKLKQKRLVEKISLNIYLDEFNDYELNDHHIRSEVEEFEHLYLTSQRKLTKRIFLSKSNDINLNTVISATSTWMTPSKIQETKIIIQTVEDALYKSITLDVAAELEKLLIRNSQRDTCYAGIKEDSLYKKMTISKKKEKSAKKAIQAQPSHSHQILPQQQQKIYPNIIFYSQADDETVSTYSLNLENLSMIPFYSFNSCEDFDFDSYFMSSLQTSNIDTKKRKQKKYNTNYEKAQLTEANTDGQLAILEEITTTPTTTESIYS